MKTPNLFPSPKKSRAASAGKLPDYAEKIGVLLADGQRLIAVPAGIAQQIAQELREAHDEGEEGWTVDVRFREAGVGPGVARLWIAGPGEEPLETPKPAFAEIVQTVRGLPVEQRKALARELNVSLSLAASPS